MKNFLTFLAAVLVSIGGAYALLHTPVKTTLFGDYNPAGAGTYRLQASITGTQSTIPLSSFTEPVSGIKYTMSYLNSSIEYGTVEPSNNTNKEFVSFTGITQNSDGSATLTGVTRGLSFAYPFTASSTFQQSHAGQSIFILSNPPQLYNNFYNLNNAATSTNVLVFSSTTPPRLDQPGAQAAGTYIATTSEFASIAYVNAISLSGVSNGTSAVKGIYQSATGLQAGSTTLLGSTGASLALTSSIATDTPSVPQSVSGSRVIISAINGFIKQAWLDLTAAWTVSGLWTFNGLVNLNATTTASTNINTIGFDVTASTTAGTTFTGYALPQPAYVATSTGSVLLSDADGYGAQRFDGFVVSSGTVGSQVFLQTQGVVSGFTSLTAGANYYVQNSIGTIGTTPGTAEILVGEAISTTQILITGPASAGDWQYLGSIAFGTESHTSTACTAYATSTFPMARNVTIDGIATGGGASTWGAQGELVLHRIGQTTATTSVNVTDSGPTLSKQGVGASWNTTTDIITLFGISGANSSSLTCSGTAYFYR